MKKISGLLILLFLISCNSKEKENAELVVQNFYKVLRKGDSLQIKKYYPDFEKLGGYYKSDNIIVKSVESGEDDTYIVNIENSFKNIKGTKFKQDISFYCKPKADGTSTITDSKGLCDFKESREYIFAVQTGFIPKKNDPKAFGFKDQQIAAKILKSQDLLELLFKEKMESLRKEIIIRDWGWEYGYVKTYANGHGTVINNSKEDFGTLKYILTFVADDGQVTKTDEGYLGYDTLYSGKSRAFTTMSSDIGNATKAYIQIQFDTYELLDQIYEAKYSGSESHLIK